MPSLPDYAQQILHQQQQMVRVAWARLECEVFVKAFGIVVFGVNDQRTRTDGLGGLRSATQGTFEQRSP